MRSMETDLMPDILSKVGGEDTVMLILPSSISCRIVHPSYYRKIT